MKEESDSLQANSDNLSSPQNIEKDGLDTNFLKQTEEPGEYPEEEYKEQDEQFEGDNQDSDFHQDEENLQPLALQLEMLQASEIEVNINDIGLSNVEEIPYREIQLLPSEDQANVNGLVNLGYSCYQNVILQALATLPGVKEYFLQDLHLKERERNPEKETLVNRMGDFIKVYYSYNDHVLNPILLTNFIKRQSSIFDTTISQEDAHEFLLFMLDRIASELNRLTLLTSGYLGKMYL